MPEVFLFFIAASFFFFAFALCIDDGPIGLLLLIPSALLFWWFTYSALQPYEVYKTQEYSIHVLKLDDYNYAEFIDTDDGLIDVIKLFGKVLPPDSIIIRMSNKHLYKGVYYITADNYTWEIKQK